MIHREFNKDREAGKGQDRKERLAEEDGKGQDRKESLAEEAGKANGKIYEKEEKDR